MKHLGTKRVETERLILRRFTMDDADAMFRNWANDPEVTKYLTWPAHPSVEVSRMVLESWVSQYDDNAVYQWAIVPGTSVSRSEASAQSMAEMRSQWCTSATA